MKNEKLITAIWSNTSCKLTECLSNG